MIVPTVRARTCDDHTYILQRLEFIHMNSEKNDYNMVYQDSCAVVPCGKKATTQGILANYIVAPAPPIAVK